MKVKITETIDEDYEAILGIEVDGKWWFTAGRGEPEDNSLCRDLNFVYEIVPFMKKAYEAGKRNEEFVVEKIKGGDE